MIKTGTTPFPEGTVWDHEGKTEIVQIFILQGEQFIEFLQFLYVENGSLVLSEPPGDSSIARKFNTVVLNYPEEFLTSINGTDRSYCGDKGLTSISFGTNKGSYGPFGSPRENDREFHFQMGQYRSFGGFHGSINDLGLESIGVYVKPIANLSVLNSAGKVKKEEIIFKPIPNPSVLNSAGKVKKEEIKSNSWAAVDYRDAE